MRINDKHLCRIAVGNTPTDKEGALSKRGEVNKSFQKRWFMLKGNLLFYFEKKGDREPVGLIIIEGCTVELAEMTDAFTFELVFPGSSSRTYILAADTQEEMESWMKAITCASYDYMKLMVTELQRQVDELNEEQRNQAAQKDSAKPRTINGDLLGDIPSQYTADKPMDPFASPRVTSTDGPSFPTNNSGVSKPFEQTHEEYGQYIQSKMREVQLSQK